MRCLPFWWVVSDARAVAERCCGLSLPDRGQAIACDLRYPVGGEAELDEQLFQRRRRPECVHADYCAAITDVRSQPSVEACSTATRAFTEGGSTSSRYAWDWRSKSSQQGMLTTRTLMPSACSSSRAASAR